MKAVFRKAAAYVAVIACVACLFGSCVSTRPENGDVGTAAGVESGGTSADQAEAEPEEGAIPGWFLSPPAPEGGFMFFAGFSGEAACLKDAYELAERDARVQAAQYLETKVEAIVVTEEFEEIMAGASKVRSTLEVRMKSNTSAVVEKALVVERTAFAADSGAYHGYALIKAPEAEVSPDAETYAGMLKKPLSVSRCGGRTCPPPRIHTG